MVRVLAVDGMDSSAVERLSAMGCEVVCKKYEKDELLQQVKNCDALIVRSATKVDRAVIDAAAGGRLALVIRAGVGLDNVDVPYARESGIAVENTPDASTHAVAELAIGHMLGLARHLQQANVSMHNGSWLKKQYSGCELHGKTLGVIGMGRIGKRTADIAQALGMRVLYYKRSGVSAQCKPHVYAPLDELLAKSDFVSLHCPKGDAAPMLGEREFSLMKDGAYVINAARGGLIDIDAMLRALDTGKLAGAALDVFDKEPLDDQRLIAHEKVALSPHIGASTGEAQRRIGEQIVTLVQSYFFDERKQSVR